MEKRWKLLTYVIRKSARGKIISLRTHINQEARSQKSTEYGSQCRPQSVAKYHSVQQAKHGTNSDTIDNPELHAVGSTEYGSECRPQSVAKYHVREYKRTIIWLHLLFMFWERGGEKKVVDVNESCFKISFTEINFKK